jgi:integrase
MSTKFQHLRVRPIVWRSGERFAMLVDNDTGVPLLVPTAYAMVVLRKKDLAFATIKQAMYAIRTLVYYTFVNAIDLSKRIHLEGKLLDLHEVEKLSSLCRLPNKELEHEFNFMFSSKSIVGNRSKVIDLFQARPSKKKVLHVDRATSNIRLLYIHDYLKWIADRELIRMSDIKVNYQDIKNNIDLCLAMLKENQTSVRNRNNVNVRKRGVSKEVIARIHEVLDPDSDENPWRPGFNRYRNRLYIYWLLGLSLRKGEALGVLLEDLDVAKRKVQIMRRPDNVNDKRGAYAPLSKTRDRILSVSERLMEYTEEYLVMRRTYQNSDDHGYLFISSWNGDPISQSAARDIFKALREKVPEIPRKLSAQILRHTWNTHFTEFAFDSKMADKTRMETMRNQNGWSDTSKMPDYYSIAAIEKEAQKVSLDLQDRIHSFGRESQNGSKKE